MAKIIIGLTGQPAAGKGAVSEYFINKYGASARRFSTPMSDCLERLHLPVNRENLTKFSLATRKEYGDDLYAKVMAEDTKNDPADVVIVDGIRLDGDVSILKTLPDFHLIYVTAPAELRHERATKRGEKEGESDMTFEQFMKEEELPTEVKIKEIGEAAEFKIDNSGTLEELHAQLDEAMKKIEA